MANLDEIALEGASIFLSIKLGPRPWFFSQEVALHRISPLECLYDLLAKVVDIVHFLWYSSHDVDGGIIFLVTQSYLPLRLALNIPSIIHAYKIFRLDGAYWSKGFATSYVLCWLFAKIYPMRPQQLSDAEIDRVRRKITNPVFFGLSHGLVCFAVFSDRLEAALWSWFGILAIAGYALAISPTPPLANTQRDTGFDDIATICLHLLSLGLLWLFEYSAGALNLKGKNHDWRDGLSFKVAAMLLFDGAMVFLVAKRTERWSMLRFGSVGVILTSMAYVYYVELYALTQDTKALYG